MRPFKTAFALASFAALFSFSAEAAAQADCYRSSDCDGDLICMDLQCVSSEIWLPLCNEAGQCDGYREVCDEGYCKPDGVACQNPAGECYADTDWGSCVCEDGTGVGWSGEEPAEATDEELYGECVDSLVELCGEEAPDISDYCEDEELETCEDFLTKLHEMEQGCYGDGDETDTDSDSTTDSDESGDDGESDEDGESSDPSEGDRDEISFWELKDCCESLGDELMQDFMDCIMELEPEDCVGLDECDDIWGGGDPADDESDDGSFDGDQEDDENDQADDSNGDLENPDAGESEISMDAGGTGCAAVPTSGLFHSRLIEIWSAI